MPTQVQLTGPVRRLGLFGLCGDSDISNNWVAATVAIAAANPYLKPGDSVYIADGTHKTWRVVEANSYSGSNAVNCSPADAQLYLPPDVLGYNGIATIVLIDGAGQVDNLPPDFDFVPGAPFGCAVRGVITWTKSGTSLYAVSSENDDTSTIKVFWSSQSGSVAPVMRALTASGAQLVTADGSSLIIG